MRCCGHSHTCPHTPVLTHLSACDALCSGAEEKNAARQEEEWQSDNRILEQLQQRQAEEDDEGDEQQLQADYDSEHGRAGAEEEAAHEADEAFNRPSAARWGWPSPAEPLSRHSHDDDDDDDGGDDGFSLGHTQGSRGTKRRWTSWEEQEEDEALEERRERESGTGSTRPS